MAHRLLLLLVALGFAAGLPAPRSAAAGSPCGIFVSATSGVDDATCGGAPGDPCRTINQGLGRAVAEGKSCVFVQAGTYNEILELRAGVAVEGGFDAAWNSAAYTVPGHEVRVLGGEHPGEQQVMTARARNLAQAATLRNLVLVGAAASGVAGADGKPSHVIHAVSSNLVLRDLRLEAGAGRAGLAGSAGGDAPAVPATSGMNGGPGIAGGSFAPAVCDDVTRGAGGPRGLNGACGVGRDSDGGAGGAGGVKDLNCSNSTFGPGTGVGGADADYTTAISAGHGALASPACANGGNGQAGAISNGTGGVGGSNGLILVGGYLMAQGGAAGTLGEHGGGGGGGAGGGGCGNTSSNDGYGGGGGGGGAGGCRALGAGGGGGAGGHSIGIALISSHASITNVAIVRGVGGAGGAGGTGGRGQQGGLGGLGGPGVNGSGSGGEGGRGGHGGHGGGGGGGKGGSAIGLYRCSNSTVTSSGLAISAGTGGAGGTGGISAPAVQGTFEDDGNDGANAIDGQVLTSVVGGACGETLPAADTTSPTCDPATCTVDAPGAIGDRAAQLSFAGITPQPVVGAARFQFSLPVAGPVRLALYDVGGGLVHVVLDGSAEAGAHVVSWDGQAAGGARVAAGVYFARLEFAGRALTRRMVLVRSR